MNNDTLNQFCSRERHTEVESEAETANSQPALQRDDLLQSFDIEWLDTRDMRWRQLNDELDRELAEREKLQYAEARSRGETGGF